MLNLTDVFSQMFSHAFMIRALLAGSAVALCASLLGVSLVLKRYSMIGDGLSHVVFGAMAIALALNLAPLRVAVPVVVLAAFFLLRISQNSRINGDAAIAMISSTSIAIGVIFMNFSSGMNADINSLMFGSVLAMTPGDVHLSLVLSIIVFLLFLAFYDQIFAITFDENFARATGVKVGFFNMLVALLTAITIVLGMRVMGTMLISSLIIFPALSSMRVFISFKSVIISSAILALVCFFLGLTASFIFGTSPGASVVVINAIAFLLFSVAGITLKR
ncbi:MAG: metal ABC transporter permease [Turicibacter sp.]|nr:metal ABC transporter permease [Turicibacter sp.]